MQKWLARLIKCSTDAHDFHIALFTTLRKELELVSGSLEGSVIQSIQRSASKKNDDAWFIKYGPATITKRNTDLFRIVKKDLVDSQCLAFSISIDATKLAVAISISSRSKSLVGEYFLYHFISLDGMKSNEIKDKLVESKQRNAIEKVVEAKVDVPNF